MKTIQLIAFSVLILNIGNSQAPALDPKADSLENVLKNTLEIEDRLPVLLELLNFYEYKNQEKCIEYALKILKEGDAIGPSIFTLEAKHYIAVDLQKRSLVDSSLVIAGEGLEEAIKINSIYKQIDFLGFLGQVENYGGRYDKAQEYYLKAWDLIEGLTDSIKIYGSKLMIANNLGNNLKNKGNYEEAIPYYQIAAINAEKAKNLNAVGVIYNNIGTIYIAKGNSEKALNYFQKSFRIRKELENKAGMLAAYTNILDVYIDNGQWDLVLEEGADHFETALEMGHPHFIPILGTFLAQAEYSKGLYNQAQQRLDKLEPYVKQSQYSEGKRQYLLRRYDVYMSLNQIDNAGKAIDQIEELNKETGYKERLSEFLLKKIELNLYKRNDPAVLMKNVLELEAYYTEALDQKFDKIGEIEANYTNLETQKQVELLEKDKALLSLASARNKLIALSGGLLSILAFLFLYQTRKKNKIIEKQNKTLDALNKTKDRIFSIIGHDLRKPVLAFRGISDKINYLLQSDNRAKVIKLGEELEKDALKLHSLTDNLLNWALLQKNLVNVKEERISLDDIVNDVLELFQKTADSKDIKLQFTDTNIFVNSDRNVLATVVRNLVDNAIKFTPYNGAVIIDANQNNNNIELTVKDSGIGFDDQQIKNLFEVENYQTTVGTDGEKGAGLGLHIVKELLEKIDAHISVKSVLSEGTSFNIVLPA